MLQDTSIICFGGEDWWYHHPHSKNHLMRRFARAGIPDDRDGQTEWLFDRWSEVDAWVGGDDLVGSGAVRRGSTDRGR